MQLKSPIPRRYFTERDKCLVNQLFGENKNALFYGPEGHNGIDFRTKGAWKYNFDKIKGFIRIPKDDPEEEGMIPIHAAHDGFITSGYNDDQREGIYVKIQDEKEKEFATTYFHLDKIRVWKDDGRTTVWEQVKGKDFVKAGTVIGWGGNSGKFTTGAHLHFTLRKNGKAVDPMPYFKDNTIYLDLRGTRYFYKGREISKGEANKINIEV